MNEFFHCVLMVEPKSKQRRFYSLSYFKNRFSYKVHSNICLIKKRDPLETVKPTPVRMEREEDPETTDHHPDRRGRNSVQSAQKVH